jgi:hypothetical protein
VLTVCAALLNFVTTAVAFLYIGSDVVWIFAFLSGFLAIVPVFSSWLVWMPASLVLVARDGVLSLPWAVMVSLHLAAWAGSSLLYMHASQGNVRSRVRVDNATTTERPEIVGCARCPWMRRRRGVV